MSLSHVIGRSIIPSSLPAVVGELARNDADWSERGPAGLAAASPYLSGLMVIGAIVAGFAGAYLLIWDMPIRRTSMNLNGA